MRKFLVVAGFILAASTAAMAQTATPPELAGTVSAREGVKSDRLAFEYFKAAPDSLMSVAKITIAPGQLLPMHTHSGPEYHFVVAGELEETAPNEAPRKLKAGEGHFAAEGAAHGLKNTGTTPAVFIAFITGKKGERLTTPYGK